MASITSVNAVYALMITKLIPAPIQLQGFAADDIFDTEALEVGEVLMGVDGFLSAGYVKHPIKQSITLQADSPSMKIFEAWYAGEKALGDKYFAQATVVLPAIKTIYTLTNGVLVMYAPIPDAKKVLQPRKFSLVWESVFGAPL